MSRADTKPGLTAKKSENFSEWFSQVCSESGAKLADIRYGVQGTVVHRPWAMRILRKIYDMLEGAVEADGHEPYLFPTFIPEENLQREKEHAGFTPEVFWIDFAGDTKLERRLAMRPTGETQIYPMYALWIRAYTDLPFKGYQSRITVFRNEPTTRPFLRGREFMFFETHDCFRTHEDALKQIHTDMFIMESVVRKRLKIPFLFFRRPSWDKFKGANDTYASDTLNPDGRRNQISSTHDLGHNFAKAFNITFMDEDGIQKHPHQTCFGPGIWRIMAALIAIHGDDKGLILPTCVAPTQVAIVPILFSKDPALATTLKEKGDAIVELLRKAGIRAHYDTREQTPGFKFNHWELLGVPLRLEIGPRELEQNKVTLVRRTDRAKIPVELESILDAVKEQFRHVDGEIEKRASAYFKDCTRGARTYEEVKTALTAHRGFVTAPWCSVGNDGENCAAQLKADTEGGVVCGTRFGHDDKPEKGSACVVCGKKANHLVYLAKSI